jgi:hypothetical protein
MLQKREQAPKCGSNEEEKKRKRVKEAVSFKGQTEGVVGGSAYFTFRLILSIPSGPGYLSLPHICPTFLPRRWQHLPPKPDRYVPEESDGDVQPLIASGLTLRRMLSIFPSHTRGIAGSTS